MKLRVIAIGKTDQICIQNSIEEYTRRLCKYTDCEFRSFSDIKNAGQLPKVQRVHKEGEVLLASVKNTDVLVLLDERGTQFSSHEFAQKIQSWQNMSTKCLVFAIGGAFGFSADVYARANAKISLSSMTFNHQMVRMILLEQLYRGYSILHGEPYHHS